MTNIEIVNKTTKDLVNDGTGVQISLDQLLYALRMKDQQLTIPVVRLSLFNEVYDKFLECEDDNEFTQYLNENTNEA